MNRKAVRNLNTSYVMVHQLNSAWQAGMHRHLNTSYVMVHPKSCLILKVLHQHLNTSYVMVHQKQNLPGKSSSENLNTSYVMVHPKFRWVAEATGSFKYILCYGSSEAERVVRIVCGI